ncbi:MAG: hypothetical protein O2780_00880 [Proteobacteria bacterium]|nr:hypothetical protein [Pseudomonadota bacterium]
MRTDYLPGRIEARSIDHGHTGRGCRAAIGRRARGVQTRSRLKQRLSAALLLVVLGSAGYADNVHLRFGPMRSPGIICVLCMTCFGTTPVDSSSSTASR